MNKDNLPKLEIDGFTYVTKKPQPSFAKQQNRVWKEKAVDIVHKVGLPIKTQSLPKAEKAKSEDADVGYKRLLIKTGVCAGVAIIILAISSMNTPVTNEITDVIGKTVNHQFGIDEDIGRLKFVQNLDDSLQSVFSPLPDAAVVFPAHGNIITAFGEAGSKGVRIDLDGTKIVSIAKGTVTFVGEINEAGYIKVALDSGETVSFYNISPAVRVDDIVMPGQLIGDIDGDYLYFELKDGDQYVDPIQYIEQRASLVVE
ncbi:MAG: peptidoglycan DD-metalloendopeptidase family protein [Christensenellales bacterium]|jgi:murein DD-endopeptidase MepM/ murein hydrolase activator NlpD